MYYKDEADKKERRKVIGVATVATAVILMLVAAIVVVTTKKSSNEPAGVSTTVLDEPSEGTLSEQPTASEEKPSEDSTSSASDLTTPVEKPETSPISSTTTETQDKMPNTGPEDIFSLALVLGMATMAVSSAVMAKSEQ